MAELDDEFFQTDESGSDIINKLTGLVTVMDQARAQLDLLDEEAKGLKLQIASIEERQIPDLLLEAGLKEVKLLDGRTIGTKLVVGAIPAEQKPLAYKWLDENGHASIIKRTVSVSFDKGQTETAKVAVEKLTELGFVPKSVMDVNYQTFAAFAKEQARLGKPLPLGSWGVFYGEKATIK